MTMTATEIRNAIGTSQNIIRRVGAHFLSRIGDYLDHRKASKAIRSFHRQDEIRLERAQRDVNNFWQGRM